MIKAVESLQGQLLIAGGGLFDPNFRHAVVLVVEHGEDGALGIVLNRPADLPAAEAAPGLASLLEPADRLFIGGPVQPEAAILLGEFDHPEPTDGRRVFGAVGVVSREDGLPARAGVRRARLFAGHAGWAPGQLEAELRQSAWVVEPARPDDVFTATAQTLWRDVLRRKGGEHAVLALMPFDPSTN
jgi:putative transcriptional regulator